MTDVFTDDEREQLITLFLASRGSAGATAEEAAEVVSELATLRVGAVLVQMVFDGRLWPDWNGTELTFSAPGTEDDSCEPVDRE